MKGRDDLLPLAFVRLSPWLVVFGSHSLTTTCCLSFKISQYILQRHRTEYNMYICTTILYLYYSRKVHSTE
jgi:hypothetical protein